jgi:hypothetical protein
MFFACGFHLGALATEGRVRSKPPLETAGGSSPFYKEKKFYTVSSVGHVLELKSKACNPTDAGSNPCEGKWSTSEVERKWIKM